MLARTLKHSWMKNLVVGLLALVFVPLSGPVFFCKCEGQVVMMSQLKTNAECCEANCSDECEETETEAEDCCSEEPSAPCDEEVDLAFATPESAGAQLDGTDLPLPLDVTLPGKYISDPALLAVFSPRVAIRDAHPPPGSGRLHLHFQILLI